MLDQAAAAKTASSGRRGWIVRAQEEAVLVRPPLDFEQPEVFCRVFLTPERLGTRVVVEPAWRAPGARRWLYVFAAFGTAVVALVAIQGWREGSVGMAAAAGGFLLFFLLILALVASSTGEEVNDEVRRFVRAAVTSEEVVDPTRRAAV